MIDDTTSYLETSATAGFAYGILKSIRKRYISYDYKIIAKKAIKGVMANINDEGKLLNVSFGTAMGNDLEYYKNIPLTSMPKID
ncbi:glycoside hydrolase family 88 protein [Gilliamella sp. B2894]|nr:glycoside hydrolase family 88 protein [Gilliamella sp. B2894]MCX8664466.1 glycoside hydrolase family 88 protein [Gilliamella sp. B2887]MCX8693270.1 glycoside hydrolase family 88 protein [Gilliamella sp. B2881]MCX8695869.1 glycoside hydrolase family 88 protein [Gilliamella sp. B2828]MCX8698501.1 glycoside hydrolase family 88 protein [Gilliamella sp. B3000]